MAERKYQSFSEFWPFYVSEHSKPGTRVLHFIGTALSIFLLVEAVIQYRVFPANLWFVLGALLVGYAFAWIGHFVVEKNRPATFTYPLWSFVGDWRMFGLILTGRMGSEVERAKQLKQAGAI